MSALAGYSIYRTGANVGVRCPCGWRRIFGRSALVSEVLLAAKRHAEDEHPIVDALEAETVIVIGAS